MVGDDGLVRAVPRWRCHCPDWQARTASKDFHALRQMVTWSEPWCPHATRAARPCTTQQCTTQPQPTCPVTPWRRRHGFKLRSRYLPVPPGTLPGALLRLRQLVRDKGENSPNGDEGAADHFTRNPNSTKQDFEVVTQLMGVRAELGECADHSLHDGRGATGRPPRLMQVGAI